MKNIRYLKLVILSVFFFQTGNMIVTPAIGSIARSFPNISYPTILLVSTLPTLIAVPVSLTTGRLAGRLISYKTLLIIAMTTFVTFGIAPFLVSNFYLILVFRAATGIAIGILMPLGMTLVINNFQGMERARMLGFGNTAATAGGIVFQTVSGAVALFLWKYSFLLYGLGVFTLVLVLFLPKQESDRVHSAKTHGIRMPISVYFFALFIFIISVLLYPLIVNMSTNIYYKGIGSTGDAGLVLTMFSVGGLVAGSVFAKLLKVFKMRSFSVALIFLSLATFLAAYGEKIELMYTATAFAGFGLIILFLTVFMVLGHRVQHDRMAMASAIIVAAMGVGNFVSSYAFALTTELLRGQRFTPFYLAASIFAIAGILSALLIRRGFIGKGAANLHGNIGS